MKRGNAVRVESERAIWNRSGGPGLSMEPVLLPAARQIQSLCADGLGWSY